MVVVNCMYLNYKKKMEGFRIDNRCCSSVVRATAYKTVGLGSVEYFSSYFIIKDCYLFVVFCVTLLGVLVSVDVIHLMTFSSQAGGKVHVRVSRLMKVVRGWSLFWKSSSDQANENSPLLLCRDLPPILSGDPHQVAGQTTKIGAIWTTGQSARTGFQEGRSREESLLTRFNNNTHSKTTNFSV